MQADDTHGWMRHDLMCGEVWEDEQGTKHRCTKRAEHRGDVPHGDGVTWWW